MEQARENLHLNKLINAKCVIIKYNGIKFDSNEISDRFIICLNTKIYKEEVVKE